jgi:hypothetical protein
VACGAASPTCRPSACSSPPRLGLPGTGNFVGEFLILIGSFASAVDHRDRHHRPGVRFGLLADHDPPRLLRPAKSDTVLAGMDTREMIMVLGLAVLLICSACTRSRSSTLLPPPCMACSSGSAPLSLNSLRPGKSAMEFTTQHFIALAPMLITTSPRWW